jgi:hypothetical protein
MEGPKHVLGKKFKERTEFECCACLDLNRDCYFLFDDIFRSVTQAYEPTMQTHRRTSCAIYAMFEVDCISSTLQLYSHSSVFNLEG